jgi:2-polyprenyl-6-methoxyphenol hydroxylase-like FAD-dependent oxidoreductase
MQRKNRTDVVIVGAGPSGLVLAIALAQRKINVHHVLHEEEIGAQANEDGSQSSLKRM